MAVGGGWECVCMCVCVYVYMCVYVGTYTVIGLRTAKQNLHTLLGWDVVVSELEGICLGITCVAQASLTQSKSSHQLPKQRLEGICAFPGRVLVLFCGNKPKYFLKRLQRRDGNPWTCHP